MYSNHVILSIRDRRSTKFQSPFRQALNTPRYNLIVDKMSALQTFMLVSDHDKQEAIRIADKVAQGTSLFPENDGSYF